MSDCKVAGSGTSTANLSLGAMQRVEDLNDKELKALIVKAGLSTDFIYDKEQLKTRAKEAAKRLYETELLRRKDLAAAEAFNEFNDAPAPPKRQRTLSNAEGDDSLNPFSLKNSYTRAPQCGWHAYGEMIAALPPGWTYCRSKVDGRDFYHNPSTGQSVWKHPGGWRGKRSGAAAAPEDDCVITGSRSAEARDVELMRDAITIEDSEEEEEGAQPTGAGTLEDHLKELRGFLDDDGFDVSVALKWCEANGADKLYEIVEADMVDDFVASFALKPVKAGVLAKKLREFRRGN